MSIRIASTAQDFSALDDLIAEYEAALPPDLRHQEAGTVRATAALLAFDETRACGCVLLTGLDARTAMITRMFVQPSQRGRGVARALMKALVEAARERGFERLVLDTDAEQLRPAYELYRSLGFIDCEPYGPVDYATPTYMEYSLVR